MISEGLINMLKLLKRFLNPNPPPEWSNREERREQLKPWKKRKKKR
jgi:hypothetical protein